MKRNIYILMVLIAALGCKKPYAPKAVSGTASYLVVEGIINTGDDSTVFKLSRTVPLTSTTGSQPETGATVIVMSDAGNSYPLTETSKGRYSAPGLNLNPSGKYGLKIITSDNKTYQSDLVQAKNSPPIDSVYYRVGSNGLEIYADTHDPANNTRYYRWDYDETYEYHSAFNSIEYYSKVPTDTVLPRSLADRIYTCWRGGSSTSIITNSSAKLTQDVITNNPIAFIASTSEKLGTRYSILVRQYAITPDAFNYYQQLKKNTEQLGSVFDAQPSELTGNIHCITDPAEAVLGYITAGSSSKTRIFISSRGLPAWQPDSPYSGCMLDTDYYAKPLRGGGYEYMVQEYIYTGIHIPIAPVAPPGSDKILGFTSSDPDCVDCTLRGTNIKPSFWIDE